MVLDCESPRVGVSVQPLPAFTWSLKFCSQKPRLVTLTPAFFFLGMVTNVFKCINPFACNPTLRKLAYMYAKDVYCRTICNTEKLVIVAFMLCSYSPCPPPRRTHLFLTFYFFPLPMQLLKRTRSTYMY